MPANIILTENTIDLHDQKLDHTDIERVIKEIQENPNIITLNLTNCKVETPTKEHINALIDSSLQEIHLEQCAGINDEQKQLIQKSLLTKKHYKDLLARLDAFTRDYYQQGKFAAQIFTSLQHDIEAFKQTDYYKAKLQEVGFGKNYQKLLQIKNLYASLQSKDFVELSIPEVNSYDLQLLASELTYHRPKTLKLGEIKWDTLELQAKKNLFLILSGVHTLVIQDSAITAEFATVLQGIFQTYRLSEELTIRDIYFDHCKLDSQSLLEITTGFAELSLGLINGTYNAALNLPPCSLLDLSGNHFDEAGTANLQLCLSKNKSLKNLVLNRIQFDHDETIQQLGLAIFHSHITKLGFQNNQLTETQINLFVNAWKSQNTLVTLDVSGCQISDESMVIMLDLLYQYNLNINYVIASQVALNDYTKAKMGLFQKRPLTAFKLHLLQSYVNLSLCGDALTGPSSRSPLKDFPPEFDKVVRQFTPILQENVAFKDVVENAEMMNDLFRQEQVGVDFVKPRELAEEVLLTALETGILPKNNLAQGIIQHHVARLNLTQPNNELKKLLEIDYPVFSLLVIHYMNEIIDFARFLSAYSELEPSVIMPLIQRMQVVLFKLEQLTLTAEDNKKEILEFFNPVQHSTTLFSSLLENLIKNNLDQYHPQLISSITQALVMLSNEKSWMESSHALLRKLMAKHSSVTLVLNTAAQILACPHLTTFIFPELSVPELNEEHAESLATAIISSRVKTLDLTNLPLTSAAKIVLFNKLKGHAVALDTLIVPTTAVEAEAKYQWQNWVGLKKLSLESITSAEQTIQILQGEEGPGIPAKVANQLEVSAVLEQRKNTEQFILTALQNSNLKIKSTNLIILAIKKLGEQVNASFDPITDNLVQTSIEENPFLTWLIAQYMSEIVEFTAYLSCQNGLLDSHMFCDVIERMQHIFSKLIEMKENFEENGKRTILEFLDPLKYSSQNVFAFLDTYIETKLDSHIQSVQFTAINTILLFLSKQPQCADASYNLLIKLFNKHPKQTPQLLKTTLGNLLTPPYLKTLTLTATFMGEEGEKLTIDEKQALELTNIIKNNNTLENLTLNIPMSEQVTLSFIKELSGYSSRLRSLELPTLGTQEEAYAMGYWQKWAKLRMTIAAHIENLVKFVTNLPNQNNNGPKVGQNVIFDEKTKQDPLALYKSVKTHVDLLIKNPLPKGSDEFKEIQKFYVQYAILIRSILEVDRELQGDKTRFIKYFETFEELMKISKDHNFNEENKKTIAIEYTETILVFANKYRKSQNSEDIKYCTHLLQSVPYTTPELALKIETMVLTIFKSRLLNKNAITLLDEKTTLKTKFFDKKDIIELNNKIYNEINLAKSLEVLQNILCKYTGENQKNFSSEYYQKIMGQMTSIAKELNSTSFVRGPK